MRIGLDIDSVTADFTGHANTLYEPWFGEPCPIVWNRWDAYLDSPRFPDWPTFQAWADKARLWLTMPFVPGAAAGIDALLAAGHSLSFLTARKGEQCIYQTEDWFTENLSTRFGLWRRDLHVGVGGKKATVPCKVYVDDSPTELDAFKAAQVSTIRFEQPWNIKHPATARVKNWRELVSLINSLEEVSA